jgi:pimeloyl-ACP methyl ester carboxylesterase
MMLVDRAVLIGHSMGVQVALETYRRHADRVAGLVLVCGASSHPLKTFRGSAALEDLLPTIQKWIHRVPGVINRVTRWALPTRLAYEVASRLEIRRELIEPADFMPYLEGLARIDSRLFVAMLARRVNTRPTSCFRRSRRRRSWWREVATASPARPQPCDGGSDPGAELLEIRTPLTPRRSSGRTSSIDDRDFIQRRRAVPVAPACSTKKFQARARVIRLHLSLGSVEPVS